MISTLGHGQEFVLQSDWPAVNGAIRAMALDESSDVLYVGGTFTEVNGSPRGGLAAFDAATGTLLPWSPGSDGGVFAMAVHAGTLHVGGSFTQLAGEARGRLGAFDLGTGTLTTWAPSVNGTVNSLLASSSTVHVAGDLTEANGVPRNRCAAFSVANGDLLPWDPNVTGIVRILIRDGNSILIGGTYTLVGGQARSMLAEVDDTLGALLPWNPAPNGAVTALTLHNGTLFCGGSFTTMGGAPRTSLAAVDRVTGAATPWAPSITGTVFQFSIWNNELIIGGFMSQVEGSPQQHLASFSLNTGVLNPPPPSPSSTVYAMVVQGDALYIGGAFTLISPNTPRLRFAAWTLCQPNAWFTDADGDGLGDPSSITLACTAPSGTVSNADDCDDGDDQIGGPVTWFQDGDGDGFGNIFAPTVTACAAPAGYADNANDCNDQDPEIVGFLTWYADTDQDGFGNPSIILSSCSQPLGFVADSTDCDDSDGSWFIGAACDDGNPATLNDTVEDDCICRGTGSTVDVRVWLEGAYTPGDLMSASLFQNGLIPLTEPYTEMGYSHIGGGGETTTLPLLDPIPGSDEHTAVDWVILELRDAVDPSFIIATQACILRRNGSITRSTGLELPVFMVAPQQFHVAVRHRNHLGFRTLLPVDFTQAVPPLVDFASGLAPTAGSSALKPLGQRMVMWSGDSNFNRTLKYSGSSNDRDLILQRIGGSVPTNTVNGYYPEDLNLDGQVRYTGLNNDRDVILLNIGGTTPTNIRADQLPD